MIIELNDKETAVFIDATCLNLDYWVFESNACEYYREILGSLIILKKVGQYDVFNEYLREAYKVFKRRGSTKIIHLAQELFPELIEKAGV